MGLGTIWTQLISAVATLFLIITPTTSIASQATVTHVAVHQPTKNTVAISASTTVGAATSTKKFSSAVQAEGFTVDQTASATSSISILNNKTATTTVTLSLGQSIGLHWHSPGPVYFGDPEGQVFYITLAGISQAEVTIQMTRIVMGNNVPSLRTATVSTKNGYAESAATTDLCFGGCEHPYVDFYVTSINPSSVSLLIVDGG